MTPTTRPTILAQAAAQAEGRTTARALIEDALEKIAAPDGEGSRAFVTVHASQAQAMADAADRLRAAGRALPFTGLPISLKDLFDIEGEPTPAGSTFLNRDAPATAHAPVVARLLAAGFIPVGRTNMTEFAFSGLGLNPHHGTPKSPWDRATGRIPGGSSSGAAVSVSDGMAVGAIGTDTGGSCRIPAALCGIVGYKPTARRISVRGVVPLSPSLDSVGPLANSVGCCAILDAIMAGEDPAPPTPTPIRGLRLLLPTNIVLDGMDAPTQDSFDRAIATLEAAGAVITRAHLPPLDELAHANRTGGFAITEAYAWHRKHLATNAAAYDQRIRARIERGATLLAADYLDLLAARTRLRTALDTLTAPYDALILPTVPIQPPTISSLTNETEYTRVNQLLLRNPSMANFFDRCAISLPCQASNKPPAALMLIGETMQDRRLFRIATGVEAVWQS